MQDENFEWRDAKAAENLRDHGIALDKAVKAFADPFAVEWIDAREAYTARSSATSLGCAKV
jgi:uncharacterized DUF497 family protein